MKNHCLLADPPFLSVLFFLAPLLTLQGTVNAADFPVTATSCGGSGSIQEAVTLANNSPGPDTITLSPGLQIEGLNRSSCGLQGVNDPDAFYALTVTEDLTIIGNGATVRGDPRWTTLDGLTNVPGLCPADLPLATIASEAPGFLRIEDGVSVIAEDLVFRDLSALVSLRQSSSVELDNIVARDIYDWFRFCDRSAIVGVLDDAAVTISNSELFLIQNDEPDTGVPDGTVLWGSAAIFANDARRLAVSNTTFASMLGAIVWGGELRVEGSRFISSGGINMISGNGVVTNSAMLSREGGDVHTRLRASNGANLQFIASTLSVGNADCPSSPSCFVQGEGAITATAGSRIVLRESAVGVGQPSVPGALLREASGGDITADPATWIQPVNSQPAETLRTLTDQPGLLTDPPGLPNLVGGPTYWPDAVTPINPGQLIDAIPDAGPNGANALVSPVSGNLVSLDALGNPRISANGTRTIGAVQVSGPQLPPTPTPAVPVPGLSLPGVIVLIFMLLVGARLRRRAR